MIFLLPNSPELASGAKSYRDMTPQELIELNGNHWRKILTIIAKLVADDGEDWRIVRDNDLWARAEISFNSMDLVASRGWLFIVGKTFYSDFPVPPDAVPIGDSHQAYIQGCRIWTPYLDYRQFPNRLIDALRPILHKQ